MSTQLCMEHIWQPKLFVRPIIKEITDVRWSPQSSVRTCFGFSSSIRLMKSPFSRQPSHSWKEILSEHYPTRKQQGTHLIPFRQDLLQVLHFQLLKVNCAEVDLLFICQLADLSVGFLQLFADLITKKKVVVLIKACKIVWSRNLGIPHERGLLIAPRFPVAASAVPPR